jgi:hypothetical protein
LLIGLATSSPKARPQYDVQRGPRYDAAEIYRLSFHGIRLGMTSTEACTRLLAKGYTRRPNDQKGRDCRPEALGDKLSDAFFGTRVFSNAGEPRLGTATDTVQSLLLSYSMSDGGPAITEIQVMTNERGRLDDLVRTVVREWGRPTLLERHAYATLAYAASPEEADGSNRQSFSSCQSSPECEYLRGSDCAAVLRRFAGVFAQVAVYDWGRWIRIEDNRPYLASLQASGALERRDWESPDAMCIVPSIH